MLHEQVELLLDHGGLWLLRLTIYYSIILNISGDQQDAHAGINIASLGLQRTAACACLVLIKRAAYSLLPKNIRSLCLLVGGLHPV